MKEYTEQYIEENFADMMAEYMEDEDTFKLINNVNKVDKDALPIVLHFIQIYHMTNMINEMTDNLENKDNVLIDDLIENKELINKLGQIVEFNSPLVRKEKNGIKKSK